MRSPLLAILTLALVPLDVLHARTVDYSEYLHPLARFDTPGAARRVAAEGHVAVVADTDSGFVLLDLGHPKQPAVLSSYPTREQTLEVEIVGSILYVATEMSFMALDVSDPTRPTLLDVIDSRDRIGGIAVAGQYAYLADVLGLQVVDISDPSSMAALGGITFQGAGLDVAVSGSYAFIPTGYGLFSPNLRVVDVSDPAAPSLAASVSVGTFNAPLSRVATNGDHLFLTDDELVVVDVSDPINPIQVAIVNSPNDAEDVTVDGNIVYVADWIRGIQVYDASVPDRTRPIGGLDGSNTCSGIAVSGDLALLAMETAGLLIADRSNPASPPTIGDTPMGFLGKLGMHGHLAVVERSSRQLLTVDVTDVRNPTLLGVLDYGSSLQDDFLYEGGYAYLGLGAQGFGVVDVHSDPTAPRIVGSVPEVFTRGIARAGRLVFCGATDGVWVVDVSDPFAPNIETHFPIAGLSASRRMVVSGDRLYLSDANVGLMIWDISDLDNARLLGEDPTIGLRWGFAVERRGRGTTARTLLWVDHERDGIAAYDATDPAALRLVGSISLDHWILDLAISENVAYCVAWGGSMVVVDVSDPSEPRYRGEVSGFANDIDVQGEWVFVANSKSFSVYPRHRDGTKMDGFVRGPADVSAPSATCAAPNPFRTSTSIRFEVPSDTWSAVSIYDVAGRRVRSFPERFLGAGQHSLTWDGTVDGGRNAAVGVYLLRIRTDSATQTHKLVRSTR